MKRGDGGRVFQSRNYNLSKALGGCELPSRRFGNTCNLLRSESNGSTAVLFPLKSLHVELTASAADILDVC